MHGLLLAASLLAAAPVADDSSIRSLIADLGSPRFARREAAEAELGRLGRVALPSLRAASGDADSEVRARAESILRRVESSLLSAPTLVRLDFADVPLAEALQRINDRDGLKLTLAPEIPALWGDRRVTLQSAEPMPFWRAVDALCAAGKLHYQFGGQGDLDQGDAQFPLYDGFAASQGLFDDHGPFRVQLTGLQYSSEIHLATEHPGADRADGDGTRAPAQRAVSTANKQFFLQMLVGAEPHLAISPGGPVRVTEATDDRGRSLILPARPDLIQRESGYLGVNPSPLVHLRLDLAHPGPTAARLRRVRGIIPVTVAMRRSDPLVIPLADPAAKTFRQGRVAISLGEVRVGLPDQAATIELAIKSADQGASPADAGADEGDEIRAVASPQQLEVLDAAGRTIPWFPSSSFFNGEEAKLTLTLLDRGAAPAVPAAIRYHGLVRDKADVPFEFRDLPMP